MTASRFIISALWNDSEEVYWSTIDRTPAWRDDEKHAHSWATRKGAEAALKEIRARGMDKFDKRLSDVQIGEQSAYGKNTSMQKIRAKKNPAFGKRKATHKAFPKAKTKKRTPFGKRQARVVKVTARKNPAPATLYLIRGTHQNGERYYFTGASFQTEKRLAARYLSSREADEVLNRIEDRIPPQLKHIDVEHA